MYIPKKLAAIAAIASTDQTRLAIASVCAERTAGGKPRLTATDGRMLLSVTWLEESHEQAPKGFGTLPAEPGWGVAIPAEALVAAAKVPPKNPIIPIYGTVAIPEIEGERLALQARDPKGGKEYTAEVEVIPATDYPDYHQVVVEPRRLVETEGYDRDADKRCVRITVDARLLARLAKTFVDMSIPSGSKGEVGIDLEVPLNDIDPITITRKEGGGTELYALLMPMRKSAMGPVTIEPRCDPKPKKKRKEKPDGATTTAPPQGEAEATAGDQGGPSSGP